jgi:branched-chain amino acid transport system permease protein
MEGLINTGIIGINLGVQYALLALGFTLIFGILGVINFAHGAFYVLGGFVAYACVTFFGAPYAVGVIGAVLATALLGYLFQLFLIEPFVDDHLATIIITLGIYLVMSNGIHFLFGDEAQPFNPPIDSVWRWNGVYMPYANLLVMAICAAAIAFVYVLMYMTELGRALRALADDRQVATAIGLPSRLLFPLAFGLATGLAGLTGALVTPLLVLSPHVGDPVVVTSFLVVILGGLGSVAGATVAAFIVGLIEAYSSVYLGGSKGALALFVLVLIMLVVRPIGMFGREARKT